MAVPEMRIDERSLSRSELTTAAKVASRAFFDDPFFTFLMPSDQKREGSLTIFFRSVLAHMGPKGRLVTVRSESDEILGVAAWFTTGGYPLSVRVQLAQLPNSLRVVARHPQGLADGNSYVQAIAKAHPKEPHWYLMLLCADPIVQRRGVGTLLLDEAFAHIDAEGVASHLETQKPDNLAYYRRFGYELRETLSPVASGPPIYTMWRASR